jgi:hypothetical protein
MDKAIAQGTGNPCSPDLEDGCVVVAVASRVASPRTMSMVNASE